MNARAEVHPWLSSLSDVEADAVDAYRAFIAEHGKELAAEVETTPAWRATRGAGLNCDEMALFDAAAVDGDWEALIDYFQRLGESYATADVSYLQWMEEARVFRDRVRARIRSIVQEIGEPTLSSLRVAVGMQLLHDLRADSIGTAYFAAQQRKRAKTEEELVETQKSLRRAEKMDALGRLAGGVAHDFNNILTVVGTYAAMLEDRIDASDSRRDDATEIRLASERAAQLTRRLLSFTRQSTAVLQVLDFDDIVSGFIPMLRRLVGEGVRVEPHLDSKLSVQVDRGEIEQVLMNLAVNARDAMSSFGRLVIETSSVTLDDEGGAARGLPAGRYCLLSVTDSGTGIPVDVQAQIFEPFFTTKEMGKGTGLGLSIVQGIVARSNGAISLYSQPGHGANFRVYLPVSIQAAGEVTQPLATLEVKLPAITVMIVDADVGLRHAAARVLREGGCTVVEAASSAEARDLCVSYDGPLHVAVVDVVLGEMRGDMITNELVAIRPEMRVLLTSGYPAAAIGTVAAAPSALLSKPFLPAELRDAVARLATATGSVRPSEPSLQPRVLLVDDDASLRKMIARLLRRSQFDVTEAETGREALALLEAKRFDVVLSDVHMPDGNGLEVLRGVRRIDLDIPVILISGRPDINSAATALEYGAFRYLTKPLDIETVERLVQHAARAHAFARVRRQASSINGAPNSAADRAGLDVRFEQALDNMWMAYQPIVDAKSGALFGVEALMRTREASFPHPGALLEAAKSLGRLPGLGRRTRTLAGTTLEARPDIPSLFMNLHPEDLVDIDLINEEAALTRIASRVILEVTERESLSASPMLAERLVRLRQLGFRIAVDDIGAGYSGLTSFADLNPEVVKIDMSLVRSIHTSTLKQRTIGALVSLCHEVGALVVGEGVETSEERRCLIDLGCDLLQGYLIARPSAELPTS